MEYDKIIERLKFTIGAEYAWYHPDYRRGIEDAIKVVEEIRREANNESS